MWCELLVVGADHAGLQAAMTAARAGVRAAIVLPETEAAPTATQFLAAIEELVERLKTRGPGARKPLVSECREVVRRIVARERQLAERLLERAGVTVLTGEWRWQAANRVDVATAGGWRPVEGDKVIVATGDDFDLPRWAVGKSGIETLADVLNWDAWPTTAVVVGADRCGALLAELLVAVGVSVTIIERRRIATVAGTRTISGGWAMGVQVERSGEASICLHDGMRIIGERVVVCTGRRARSIGRNFSRLGVRLNNKGCVWCGSNHETVLPDLYVTGTAVAEPTTTNGFDAAVAILKDAFPARARAAAQRHPRLPAGWSLVG